MVQSILTTRPIIAIERGGRTGDLVKYKTMYSNTRQFIGKLVHVLKDLFNCLILLYWMNFIGTITETERGLYFSAEVFFFNLGMGCTLF